MQISHPSRTRGCSICLSNHDVQALIESSGGEIRPYHLYFLPEVAPEESASPPATPSETSGSEIPLNLEQAEMWIIKRAIAQTSGNISEAARLLGTNRNRIYRALAQEEH